MAGFKTYCEAVETMDMESPHRLYHDTQYGFTIPDDDELFGRLILEINQAGINWTIILNKQENFRKAYHGFSVTKTAAYKEKERERLLADAGIIRNKLKIDAAIYNANVILQLQKEYGSFRNWLDSHLGKTHEEWTKLFKKTFKFTGGEITKEFLISTGYLPGAHGKGCPVYEAAMKSNPPWTKIINANKKKGNK